MIRWIAIVILTLGIASVSFWGYAEHEEKNEILIQAENTYQRAFHELSYHMDTLHDKIGVSLAVSSHERLSPQLVDIWRLTSEALANVGQLPLSLLPFNKTEQFLSDIGEFTYRTAVRDLDEEPLTDAEIDSLKSLYNEAEELRTELREVQHIALKENLRWMDVQLALASDDEPMDNTIIDGFKTVEEQVGEYTESQVDSPIIGSSLKDETYNHLDGEFVTEREALNIGERLFNITKQDNMSISKSGSGADVSMYSLTYKNDDKSAYLDMTEQGGHPLTLLVDRKINDKKLSLHDGFNKAKQYLKDFDYESMVLFESSEYDQVGVYSFIFEQDGVRIHPDHIEIKVALDNGDILGFNAKNYLMNHHERKIEQPKIKEADIENFINEKVQVEEIDLAVIHNDLQEEVLTYEILGTYENETYRIFINAIDGKEEKVERLVQSEVNFSE